jgi:nucleotide-binding universal stress UspA family protein
MSTPTNATSGATDEVTDYGIVVGYDGTPGAQLALDWAIETAKRDDRQLTLLHCVGLTMTPTFGAYDPAVHAHAYDEMARGVLAEAVEIASKSLDRNDIRALTVIGSAAAELTETSAKADLVVTGSRGHGTIAGGLLGSTSYAVTAHAHCPAVVVRGPEVVHAGPSRPVVVAFDDSKHAQAALDLAIPVACAAEAQLHVVSVDNVGGLEAWPETDTILGRENVMEAMHDHLTATLRSVADETRRAHPGLNLHTNIVGGAVGPAIAGYAEDVHAGLIVMGSRGHGGFTGMLLGSVSHRVIHDATCPVMVVR